MCVCVSQFSVFLGLIFFLELTAGILAFVFKDWIKDQLNFFINNNVKAYRDDIDLQNLIDFAQEYVSPPALFFMFLLSSDSDLGSAQLGSGQDNSCSFAEQMRYYYPIR